MSPDNMILGIVVASALITVVLRTLPFIATTILNNNSYFTYLERQMPMGVTLLLVAYTFKNVDFLQPPYGLPMISATLLLLMCYLLTKRTVLSIFFGLGWHIFLVNSTWLSTVF